MHTAPRHFEHRPNDRRHRGRAAGVERNVDSDMALFLLSFSHWNLAAASGTIPRSFPDPDIDNHQRRIEEDPMARFTIPGTKFDFDIGNLTESPCRRCPNRNQLPRCTASCQTLGRVQTLLSCSVSSMVSHAPEEAFTVSFGE